MPILKQRFFLHAQLVFVSLSFMLITTAVPAQTAGPFETTLKQYLADRILDGPEYQQLQKLPGRLHLNGQDQVLASSLLNLLDRQTGPTGLDFKFGKQIFRFYFEPFYSEQGLLQGQTRREVLSKISQGDMLVQTQGDNSRCAPSSLLSAHYLIYGNFQTAFNRLNIHSDRTTYQLIHLAQERLYNHANTDQRSGLSPAYRVTYNRKTEQIETVEVSGEIRRAADMMALRLQPLTGTTLKTIHQRRPAVQAYLKNHPEAPLLVSVYMDLKTGKLHPPQRGKTNDNHAVLVFKESGKYWLLNSGTPYNGRGDALMALSAADLERFVYNTQGEVYGINRL